jgi:hypothetical protein
MWAVARNPVATSGWLGVTPPDVVHVHWMVAAFGQVGRRRADSVSGVVVSGLRFYRGNCRNSVRARP